MQYRSVFILGVIVLGRPVLTEKGILPTRTARTRSPLLYTSGEMKAL